MEHGRSPKEWDKKKKILVIGAGASGLASIKGCKEESDKLEVVCYEKSGEFGGLWRHCDFNRDKPSVMKPTISNMSKEMSSFSDFPAPAHFPSYMHYTDVLKYLELYAEHFDLLRHITYYQKVNKVTPAKNYKVTGKWLVKVQDLKTSEKRIETYDGVMLCVGHHTYPFIPSYPNQEFYKGKVLHSHSYKRFNDMKNKNVLVVGAGKKSADIAAELSNVASKVYLSTRRGTLFTPRLKGKKPAVLFLKPRSNVLTPKKCSSKNLEKIISNQLDHKRPVIKSHRSQRSQLPTITDEIQAKLLACRVNMKHSIKEFTENGVMFDGEDQATLVDVVVFVTGYKFKFPLLKEGIIQVTKDNKVELYKYMFPPHLRHHTLAVIGLIPPSSGSLFPVFEMQARWYVALMIGSCCLPKRKEMIQNIKSTEGFRAKQYLQFVQHSKESPWQQYMDEIAEKINVKPKLSRYFMIEPQLYWACFFGPCLPFQYRLRGPHKWSEAGKVIKNYNDRVNQYYGDKEDLENTADMRD